MKLFPMYPVPVSGKTSLAVLEGILIRAKSGVLSFLGYDLDLGISAQMDAQVEEEGEIVLSAKLFVDMMRRMNGDTVTIHTDRKILNGNQKRCDRIYNSGYSLR